MTNREFAEAVGVSQTMASRMRNGKRAPSVATLTASIAAFELNEADALKAARAPIAWGQFLREQVFSRTSAPARADSTAWRPGDQPAGSLIEGGGL